MLSLSAKYRIVHEQGFVPIFVGDQFDALTLAECAMEAGANAIEITCRRPNAHAEVEQIKRSFPDLVVLVGSLVDEGALLKQMQRRDRQFPSIGQLAGAGADGFVSALPLSGATIRKYAGTHLLVPGVETLTEAVAVIEHGAHFAKLFTADLGGGPARVTRLTCAATHGLVPLFVTGGITLPRVSEYLNAGAAVVGSGWDVICGADYAELQKAVNRTTLIAQLRRFLDEVANVRPRKREIDDRTYFNGLRHYCPFAEVP